VFTQADRLVEPVGLLFASNGRLYVTSSSSWAGTTNAPGSIVAVDASGVQSLFVTHTLLRGPDFFAETPPADAGGGPRFLVQVEDADDFGTASTDAIVRTDGTSTDSLVPTSEGGSIEAGPGGAFGTDYYITSRDLPPADAPYRVFKLTAAGTKTAFPITESVEAGSREVVGSWYAALGKGGAFGTDLYVATLASQFDPGAINGVFRVNGSGSATRLVEGVQLIALAHNPQPGGAFGSRMYATSADRVVSIDAAGTVTPFVGNLVNPAGITFGPDGLLYVAESSAARVLRVRPCR
jgi:hypothetical protein